MKNRKSVRFLVIALAVCLVFSCIAGMVQSDFGKVKVSYVRKTLSDMINEIGANNTAYGKDVEVSFGTASSTIVFGTAASSTMEFKLFVPKNATNKSSLPAIVMAPGMDDIKDDMAPLYRELARRGFVVAVVDKAGEGNSDLSADGYTQGSAGMVAVIEYIMSLPYVDENQVGITGHSNGNKFMIIAMNHINLETKNHVAAFLMGQGTGFMFRLDQDAVANVKFGLMVGKNDESDTSFFKSAFYDQGDDAKNFIRLIYPEFEGDSVPLGTWFTAEGPQELSAGKALDAEAARVLYNPPTTHPGMEFSRSGVNTFVDFFYGAFGVPEGSTYLDGSKQGWQIMSGAQFIALLAFLAMIFPMIDLLLDAPAFARLRREKDEHEDLRSFSDPRESVPTILMLLSLCVIGALSYFPMFRAGATLLPPTTLLPLSFNYMNQITYWVMIMSLIVCAAVIVFYWLKKLLYRGSGTKPLNPFACADISLRDFLHSLLFAAVLYLLTVIPIVIARVLFKVDFRIAHLKYTWYRPERIIVILRYTAIFGLYYLMNAILTANTRFRDFPDKASVAIVSLGNALGMIILLVVQYTALVNNHLLKVTDMASATIQLWKLLLPMLMAPMIARYIYNRTKNIWIAAAFNAIFFTAMNVALTGITTGYGLFAM